MECGPLAKLGESSATVNMQKAKTGSTHCQCIVGSCIMFVVIRVPRSKLVLGPPSLESELNPSPHTTGGVMLFDPVWVVTATQEGRTSPGHCLGWNVFHHHMFRQISRHFIQHVRHNCGVPHRAGSSGFNLAHTEQIGLCLCITFLVVVTVDVARFLLAHHHGLELGLVQMPRFRNLVLKQFRPFILQICRLVWRRRECSRCSKRVEHCVLHQSPRVGLHHPITHGLARGQWTNKGTSDHFIAFQTPEFWPAWSLSRSLRR